MISILRIIGVFLAMGHFLGLLMFWSTIQHMTVGIPLSLLIVSLFPTKRRRLHLWLLIIPFILIVVSYTIAGVPFLKTQDDSVARLLHFVELLLVFILSLNLVIKNKGDR